MPPSYLQSVPVAGPARDGMVLGAGATMNGEERSVGHPGRPARGAKGDGLRRWLAGALASLALLGPSAAVAGVTYHVAPGGRDTNPGSASSPWASIQRAANTLGPGDTVIIAPGVYRESVGIARSGAAGAYITYQAMPGAVLESPDRRLQLEGPRYRPRRGLHPVRGIRGARGYSRGGRTFAKAAHHIEILDCHLHHNRSGVGWLGSSYGLGRAVSHPRQPPRAGWDSGHGAHDIVVRDTVSYNHDDGLGCDGDADGFAADETRVQPHPRADGSVRQLGGWLRFQGAPMSSSIARSATTTAVPG